MKTPLLTIGLLTGLLALPSAATDRMPLAEVQPGMVGVGLTVFEGATREEFTAHVIGVLHNINGPQRSLILARLEGGPLARTGVLQGMSGSPVYVDGRLIGAVSYALGAFSTEAIAGITPIDEMIDAVALPASRPPPPEIALDLPISSARLVDLFRATLRPLTAFASSASDVTGRALSLFEARQATALLRPIATPLVLSGFEADTAELLSSTFRGTGLTPMLGGTQPGDVAMPTDGPLQGGDAISVTLINGDLTLAGTGTVTMVEDDRVYAFGHSFQNLGPTQFIMNRAYIHTVLPSLMSSMKIATVGEAIGTFQQDRLTAIAGTIGDTPQTIPVDVTLRTTDGRHPDRQLHFTIVDDPVLTPLLAYVTVLNTLRAYERDAGAATLHLSGTARLRGQPALMFDDIFAGRGPSIGAATSVLTPITLLALNRFAPVSLESLSLDIVASETSDITTIERIWLDEPRLRPGRRVSLKILTRTHRGAESIRTVPIAIPANAPPSLSLLVSGGPQLAQFERQELQGDLQPRTLRQLIRRLNESRRNNRLYVRLLGADAGAVVGGEPLSALPPSALAVYRSDRSRGAVTPLRRATLDEWEFETDQAIAGSRLLTLSLGRQ